MYQFVAALTAVRELGCVLEVQRFQKLPRNTRERMPLLFPRQVARRDQVVPVRGAVPNLQSIVKRNRASKKMAECSSQRRQPKRRKRNEISVGDGDIERYTLSVG